MSTNLPSDWRSDPHGDEVNTLVTEHMVFSSLNSLIEFRRHAGGLTKTQLAERLDMDKGSVTKLTSQPTNMKVSTIARFAFAMNARAVLVFIANEDSNLIFTPTGILSRGQMQVNAVNAAMRSVRPPIRSFGRIWVDQHKVRTDA